MIRKCDLTPECCGVKSTHFTSAMHPKNSSDGWRQSSAGAQATELSFLEDREASKR